MAETTLRVNVAFSRTQIAAAIRDATRTRPVVRANIQLNLTKTEINRISTQARATPLKLRTELQVRKSDLSKLSQTLRTTPIKVPVMLTITRGELARFRRQIGTLPLATGAGGGAGGGGGVGGVGAGVGAGVAAGRGLSAIGAAGSAVAGGAAGLGVLSLAAGKAFRAYSEFDFAVARVNATLGINRKQGEALTETLERLGAETLFTATESAQAAQFLTQAGLGLAEAQQALRPSLNLAVVGGLDIGTSADLLTNVGATFGYEVERYGELVDLLTASTTATNTSVLQMGDALKVAGGLAQSAGVPMAELAAVIGTLSNQGIQGAEAGHGLNVIIRAMYRPTQQAQEIFDRLGVSFRDASGEMRPFSENLRALVNTTFNTEELFRVFGTEGVKHFDALRRTGVPALDALIERFENAEGSTRKFFATLEDTPEFKITQLRSAIDGLVLSLGKLSAPIFTPLVEDATKLSNILSDIVTSIQSIPGFGAPSQTGILNAPAPQETLQRIVNVLESQGARSGRDLQDTALREEYRRYVSLLNQQGYQFSLISTLPQFQSAQARLPRANIPSPGLDSGLGRATQDAIGRLRSRSEADAGSTSATEKLTSATTSLADELLEDARARAQARPQLDRRGAFLDEAERARQRRLGQQRPLIVGAGGNVVSTQAAPTPIAQTDETISANLENTSYIFSDAVVNFATGIDDFRGAVAGFVQSLGRDILRQGTQTVFQELVGRSLGIPTGNAQRAGGTVNNIEAQYNYAVSPAQVPAISTL